MRRALFIAFLIALPVRAQSGATGNWIGTYSYSVLATACSNRTFTASGSVSMNLLQTGTSIAGRIDIVDFLTFTGQCTPANIEVTRVIVGTVSGDAITFSISNLGPDFSGTIDKNAITATWTDSSGGAGSLTVTRTTAVAAVDVTGEWSGHYNFTDRCSNGGTQNYSGTFSLGLRQSGPNAAGVVTMESVPLYDQNCRTLTAFDVVMSVAGTVSGSTFTGGVFDPAASFEFPITANIDGSSLSGSVMGANDTNTTGTLTLMRTSAATPAANFGGSYEGSYAESDNVSFSCLNLRRLNYAGAASLSIVQAGSVVSGWLIFHDSLDVISDGFGNCGVVEVGDVVLPVYGTISGETVTLTLPLGGGAVIVFEVVFSGNDVSGTIDDSFGDTATFDATKTASETTPPRRRAVRP